MLLMIEKGIRGEICYGIRRYTTVNNKYMRNYNKAKESLYRMCWDRNNLYRWIMSENLPAGDFKSK